MLTFIDNILDRITMYRVVLYFLIFLLVAALGLSYFKLLPFTPLALLFSTTVIVVFSWLSNKIFARFLNVPANAESYLITALILVLLITPPQAGKFAASLPLLFWASTWAQASKYILNLRNKHIFNPAAFAVVLTSLTMNSSASWWVGTAVMLPFVLFGGVIVVRKMRRFGMVLAFMGTAIAAMVVLTLGKGDVFSTVWKAVITSPMTFLASVMLTEPFTMPPTFDGQLAYGIFVGWLFAPQTHLGFLYFTPEMALLAGNAFTYIISPKDRLVLYLKEKRKAGEGIFDFAFSANKKFSFHPGQYMEWTLSNVYPDSRGNRRYFTLANSPTEEDVLLGIKFYENSSGYKKELLSLNPGDKIIASQLAGDFVLPKNKNEKLVFIAGGIGITPFRSMIKYLLDKQESREITVFYSNRNAEEVAYYDVLGEAEEKLGIKTVYALTDKKRIPEGWHGYVGHFNGQVIAREVPDYLERTYYISGSHNVVESFKSMLKGMGVKSSRIVTDFFPGLA